MRPALVLVVGKGRHAISRIWVPEYPAPHVLYVVPRLGRGAHGNLRQQHEGCGRCSLVDEHPQSSRRHMPQDGGAAVRAVVGH